MLKFKLNVVTSLVSLCVTLSAGSVMANQDENVLPDAKSGECYAKVLVPPVYKTESVKVVTNEATESLSIIPAKYAASTERVLIKESSTQLTAIAPEYKKVNKRIKVSNAESMWVRDSLKSTVAVSKGTLADLAGSGVNLDSVKPGSCFYEHYAPATYKEVEEKIMTSAQTETLSVVPAKYAESEKQVMIKAASKRLIEVPAVFKTVKEKVLVEPAKSVWKKGRGPIMRIDNATGEIMCRVDLPAVYETIEKQVVAAPPLTTSVVIPAEFEAIAVKSVLNEAKEIRSPVPAKFTTIAKREQSSEGKFSWVAKAPGNVKALGEHTGTVACYKETPAVFKIVEQRIVKTPGSFKSAAVPAVYKNVPIQKLVADASVKKSPIPAVDREFVKRVKVSDASLQWRPVLCETNMTDTTISDIQTALADNGYSPGSIDGVLGRGTLLALEKFQKSKNLAQGGITYATLEALGIEL